MTKIVLGTCQPIKDCDVLLSAFPKDTHSKQACRLFLLTIPLIAKRQAEKLWILLLKKCFGFTLQGNRTRVYRIHNRRSNV